MSAKVSTLLNVAPGAGRYVFLLIGWNDYADPVRDELNRQADAFGMDLGPSGVLVQAYPQRMYEIAREVMGKPWPPEIAERFQSDQDVSIQGCLPPVGFMLQAGRRRGTAGARVCRLRAALTESRAVSPWAVAESR